MASNGSATADQSASVDRVASEHVLVVGIRANDSSAFDALFRAYCMPLCALAGAYLRSEDLGAELVQDLFCWIWEHRHTWDVQGDVRHYLYSAVRRHALQMLRHQAVVERWQTSAAGDLRLAGLGQRAAPVDVAMDDAELVRAIRRVIDRLPERRREAFVLRWDHRLTYPEIAQLMGVTVKAVERHLTLALHALRHALT